MNTIVKALLMGITLLLGNGAYAGEVARGQFTRDIVDREPIDRVDQLDSSQQNEIKYFTELLDLQGQNVTHQWVYDDEVVFEKSFSVAGPRWRVWTSKKLPTDKTGYWYVNTLDGERNNLLTQSFDYR